jgi:hypothetical protein
MERPDSDRDSRKQPHPETDRAAHKPAAPVRRTVGTGRADSALVLIFSGTLLCSAFLLFTIQPLLGKLLLPRLGGSPQVWNTCMVFFQAVLFAGYLHAHYTGAYLGLRRQAILHAALASLALLALPIGLANITWLSDTRHPVLSVFLTLTASIGAPMFVISSTAPLLQKWFSHTLHPAAHDPYFLYAASNLGSLLALLAYPVFIEPSIGLSDQAWMMSWGFAALVVAVLGCASIFGRAYRAQDVESATRSDLQTGVTSLQKLLWTLLSFTPSSLLLGVTTYITTDIAAVPLFWIVPLALYLLTFVLVFARRPPIPHHYAVRAQALLLTLLAVMMLAPVFARMWWLLFVHLLAFFVTALVCHGELVRSRPATQHLTQFYLWLSLGGLLGGAFNALIAPVLFNESIEYPLALALACFLRPGPDTAPNRRDFLLPLALLLAILAAVQGIATAWNLAASMGDARHTWLFVAIVALAGSAGTTLLRFSDRRFRFGMGVSAVLIAAMLIPAAGFDRQERLRELSRSFFGIYEVHYDQANDATILTHGTTVHGAQSRNPSKAMQPLTYFDSNGPFGDILAAMSNDLFGRNVAVVGLGSGALTCLGHADTKWTYYEIDPVVEKIARDPRHFTYLRDCPPRADVVIGDARLMLRGAPDAHYTLIVIDAFSSDAIPVHLLTKEALAEYLTKLTPDGILAIHITNRHLNLEPVVANLARDSNLVARINPLLVREQKQTTLIYPAIVAVLTRQEAHLRALATNPAWRSLTLRPNDRLWTDDYVNIPSALRYFGDRSQPPVRPTASKPQ